MKTQAYISVSQVTTPLWSVRRRRARRGQSVIVALLVLILLGFVGALFVSIVGRNLQNTARAGRVLTAGNYADAGIRFADAQITYGPDGADWRPPLQYALATPPTAGTRESGLYAAAATSLAAPDPNDPDKAYLEQGFSRYTTGDGRFLIRVTYDPVNASNQTNPSGRYLKIESVGREGIIIPTDPTTFTNQPPSRLNATLIAYKPIGITDYGMFDTNLEKRTGTAAHGVTSAYMNANYTPMGSSASYPIKGIITPGVFDFTGTNADYAPYPIITTLGAADAYLQDMSGNLLPNPTAGTGLPPSNSQYKAVPGGGSLRSNTSLRFYGQNALYLNTSANPPLFQDTVEVNGDLLLDNFTPAASGTTDLTIQDAALILNPTNVTDPTTGTYVGPSNSPDPFNTFSGRIRDSRTGVSQNDANGDPRAINRLDPPLMDATDPASSLPRYRALALASPPRLDPATNKPYPTTYAANPNPANPNPANPNPSFLDGTPTNVGGYGQVIYINNFNDVQPESVAVGGGSTLVNEWLSRTPLNPNPVKQSWQGNIYTPPGVNITLGTNNAPAGASNPATYFGLRVVRSDIDNNQASQAILWRDPDPMPADAPDTHIMDVRYDDLQASNEQNPTASGYKATAYNLNNDIMLYAEGNIRVHGILSPDGIPRHITIVTNGTAYVDGNLLKGAPDSSITILAHDYVCVNTSQFTAGPQLDENFLSGSRTPLAGPDSTTGQHFLDFSSAEEILFQEFNFGLPTGVKPSDTVANGGYGGNLALYVSGEPGATPTKADFSLINPTGVNMTPGLTATFGSALHTSISLSGATALANAVQTDVFALQVKRDSGTEGGIETGDFLLERVAVLPMDIRVEAVLYAQTKSFFVIPGVWFNTDVTDRLDKQVDPKTKQINASLPRNSATAGPDIQRFPLYGQPIDMKIIVDGAVSEARPADISAQSAWMQKWGWIPHFHGNLVTGNTLETAGHVSATPTTGPTPPAIGLQIIYNPQAGYPFSLMSTGNVAHYLRYDAWGRPLPFSPRLPASTSLLYAGQSGEQPLLQ